MTCNTTGQEQQREPRTRESGASSRSTSILNFAPLAFQGRGYQSRDFHSAEFCPIASQRIPQLGLRGFKKILLSFLCYETNRSWEQVSKARSLGWCSLLWIQPGVHSPSAKLGGTGGTCPHPHKAEKSCEGHPAGDITYTGRATTDTDCWRYVIQPFVQGSDVLLISNAILLILQAL